MVLAAGLGTRLKPLTDKVPKVLVPIEGMPLLEHVLRRLSRAGVREAIVNAHHFADQVAAFVTAAGPRLDMRLEVSRENELLLDTGGGLKKAAWFFDDGRPFFVYNADVVTDLDLGALYDAHLAANALATLAVQKRETKRRLLFDASGRLRGRRIGDQDDWVAKPAAKSEPLAYTGIQVASPSLFGKLSEEGPFSITAAYLRLAGQGELIAAHRVDQAYWSDIGDPARLAAARERAAASGLPL